jgi:phosphatidate cytidylyltransferase
VTRLLSGIALAAVALSAIMFLPLVALRLAAIAVAVLAADEYLRLVGPQPRLPSLILVALVCWYVPLGGLANLLYLGLAVFAWLVIEVMWRGVSLPEASARFLAPWYIGLPMGMLAGIHAAGGRWVTLLLIGTIVVSDSAQYYTGRAFGRRPLAPVISPKKTVEGAIGGVVFGTLFVVFFELAGLNRDLTWRIMLGMMIVTLGIVGDLFESKLKRSSGIKDSSSLIPGHGGVLDRIDALLFAAPAFYLYMR